MTSTASRRVVGCLLGISLVACTPIPPGGSDEGNTTTTYGNSNSNSDDGDPGDATSDDGTDPDPSDVDDGTDPDPSDDDWDSEDGDGDPEGGVLDIFVPGDQPNGSTCTADSECMSGHCYVVPFLGGQCGECTADGHCTDGGCTPPNPFESNGSFCNMGEKGGGCQSDDACAEGLSCSTVLDLLGLIVLTNCGECQSDMECIDGQICAPIVDVGSFSGYRECITPNSLEHGAYCDLEGNGDQVCESGICSVVDIMGLAEIGSCGQCNVDSDCGNGFCTPGEFLLDTGTLTGSTCQ